MTEFDRASQTIEPLVGWTSSRMSYQAPGSSILNRMKVAAYQSPMLAQDFIDVIELTRQRVRECEANGVSVLCCAEAILGGLADFNENPSRFAIRADAQLTSILTPLASDTVTSIVGFTELGGGGTLYNSAAVFQRGCVAGVYRKIHPAIRRSAYTPGYETPVFRAGDLTFGIVTCNDSNYPDLAGRMIAHGARALFIPTNNSLPNERASLAVNAAARSMDIALATENRIWVIRADVAGRNDRLACFGSSEIVNPHGKVVREARLQQPDLLVANIDVENDGCASPSEPVFEPLG